MSDAERNALEESSFEVDELDDSQLEDVAGGLEPENGSQCSCTNESRCGSGASSSISS